MTVNVVTAYQVTVVFTADELRHVLEGLLLSADANATNDNLAPDGRTWAKFSDEVSRQWLDALPDEVCDASARRDGAREEGKCCQPDRWVDCPVHGPAVPVLAPEPDRAASVLQALKDLRAAAAEAYVANRVPAEPFVRAGNVIADYEAGR